VFFGLNNQPVGADPDVIAREIVEDLEAALEQFKLIASDLGADNGLTP
jgi:hypothetical protein